MSWIAPRLTDGLCNRLFQIAAASYHAKKNNRRLVFYIPRVQPSVHSNCMLVFKLFPQIDIVWSVKEHAIVKEEAANFAEFAPLQIGGDNTVIEGYFQNWSYFEDFVKPNLKLALTVQELETFTLPSHVKPETIAWAHVRLGDYMKLPHHQCTDEAYWRKALALLPVGTTLILFSDTMGLATELINKCGESRLNVMPASPDLSAIATLYLMSQCGGGCIGSNSSFSWWGMYLSLAKERGAVCVLPEKWHKNFSGGPYAPWIKAI